MAHNWKALSPFTQIQNAQFTMLGHLIPSEPLDFSAAPMTPSSPASPTPPSPVLDLSIASKCSPPPPICEGSSSPTWGRDSPLDMPRPPLNMQMLKRKASGGNTRPFKAYPRFPAVPVGLIGGQMEQMMNRESMQAFECFRTQMLAKMNKEKGRANRTSTAEEAGSPQHPSSSATDLLDLEGKDGKDAAYWERRRKNNEAAKRSRDNRRNKEDDLAIWASFLEQENLILKSRLAQGGICNNCLTMRSSSN